MTEPYRLGSLTRPSLDHKCILTFAEPSREKVTENDDEIL